MPDPFAYASDEAEVQRERDYTPRATALLTRIHEWEGEILSTEQRLSLESLAFALGLHQTYREDLSDAGVLSFEKRLAKIVGANAL